MKWVFADTLYWYGLSNPRDQWHRPAALARTQLGDVGIVTTEEVLVEFLGAMSGGGAFLRQTGVELVVDRMRKGFVKMSNTIELTPEQSAILKAEASARGTDERIVLDGLIAGLQKSVNGIKPENRALIELLDTWSEEDATEDPVELESREADWQALRAGLNANRAANGERRLFP